MAVDVKATKPLDHTAVYEIESEDPSVLGLKAFIGSVATDRVLGKLWFKFGGGDTDWKEVAFI